MNPYYRDESVTIYHGDCREIVHELGGFDLVLKTCLINSSESVTIRHDENQTRTTEEGDGAGIVGAERSGDNVAVSRSEMVAGTDRFLLRSISDGDGVCSEKTGDRVTREGAQREREREIQGRHTEQTISPDDRERQMLNMFCDEAASCSPQERRSLGQPSGKPTDPLRELSQSVSQDSVVGKAKIVCITDPPYGMKKADWDMSIPCWLPLVGNIPIATFCGVVGMRDYPTPDWVGAWVRVGSTQRNGRLRGFNNWEPILFYNIPRLANDVISVPNYHPDTGHPTTKPTKLFERLIELMPEGIILDPFAGSGTTGRAAKDLGRKAVLIEIEERYCEIAANRMRQEVLL